MDGAQHAAFEGRRGGWLRHLVAEDLGAGHGEALAHHVLLFSYAHDFVSAGRGVVRCQMAVLAGKVLMDEKQAHYSGSRMPRRK
jgi:hypothetical protein